MADRGALDLDAPSAIIGGILCLMIGVAWLWRWLAHHEADVQQRWEAVIDSPWVAATRRRPHRCGHSSEARLSPRRLFRPVD